MGGVKDGNIGFTIAREGIDTSLIGLQMEIVDFDQFQAVILLAFLDQCMNDSIVNINGSGEKLAMYIDRNGENIPSFKGDTIETVIADRNGRVGDIDKGHFKSCSSHIDIAYKAATIQVIDAEARIAFHYFIRAVTFDANDHGRPPGYTRTSDQR